MLFLLRPFQCILIIEHITKEGGFMDLVPLNRFKLVVKTLESILMYYYILRVKKVFLHKLRVQALVIRIYIYGQL